MARSRPRPLTWWILVLALVPMIGAVAHATLALSRHPENASDREAAAALLRVSPAVDQALDAQSEELARLGSVIARDPKFYAVLTLPSASRTNPEYRDALDPVLQDFQREAGVPVFVVTTARGKLLGRAAEPTTGAVDPSGAPFIQEAMKGTRGTGFLVERNQIYRVATVPISAGGVLVGTLTLGTQVDGEFGGRLKTAMEADVTILVERDIAATTLVPSPLRKALAAQLSGGTLDVAKGVTVPVITAGNRRYIAIRREIDGPVLGGGSLGYVLTRPLGSDASPLAKLEADLVRAAGVGIALALLCGGIVAFAVSRQHRGLKRAAGVGQDGKERDRARSAILATVGPRVLDPAQTIHTITDLVADGALGEVSGPQREGMLAIRRASGMLTRLGHDLVAVAALERDDTTLARDSVDVGNLLDHTAALLLPIASDRRQMVELSVEPGLVHPQVDRALLSRVVEGLALYLVERAPVATKVVLGARRAAGGIEVLVAGARPERGEGVPAGESVDAGPGGPGVQTAQDDEVVPTLARLFVTRYGGAFEILSGEALAFRLWLPIPPDMGSPGAVGPFSAAPPAEVKSPAGPADPASPARAA